MSWWYVIEEIVWGVRPLVISDDYYSYWSSSGLVRPPLPLIPWTAHFDVSFVFACNDTSIIDTNIIDTNIIDASIILIQASQTIKNIPSKNVIYQFLATRAEIWVAKKEWAGDFSTSSITYFREKLHIQSIESFVIVYIFINETIHRNGNKYLPACLIDLCCLTIRSATIFKLLFALQCFFFSGKIELI